MRSEAKYDMRINIKESRWRRREFLELGATTTAMAAFGGIGQADRSGAPTFPPFFQFLAMGDIVKATTEKGGGEYFPMYAGQGVGSLRDLPRAADVMQSLVREARAVITGLHHRVKSA
jgi:hypothetical protein